MTYTILNATYASADNSAAILRTAEAGDVVASESDTPELWAQMLQGVVHPFPSPTLADHIAAAVLKIDADADAIRHEVLGFRTTEYQMALSDAQAFQAAGFVGAAPPGVQSWLDAKTAVGAGWTAQQAAQDILDTGASWKSAEEAIRANRLLRKEQSRVAAAQVDVDAAMANWAGFVAAIRSQLGLPPSQG